jgi:phenylalanyl-tRNA synthetase beta chain
MRSSLVGSLVQMLRQNLARKLTRARLFEIGRVYRKDLASADGPLAVAGVEQPMRLAALAYGPAVPAQWGSAERGADFFDIKGEIEALLAPVAPHFEPASHPALHPGRCAAVRLGDRVVGHVGELHPRWRQAYDLPLSPLLFELELDAVLAREVPVFAAISRQQPVSRDVALVVRDGVAHDAIVAVLRADPAGLIRNATLFDVWKPLRGAAESGLAEDERSLAIRLELLDFDQTLTDDRIDAAVQAAVSRATATFGARLRS